MGNKSEMRNFFPLLTACVSLTLILTTCGPQGYSPPPETTKAPETSIPPKGNPPYIVCLDPGHQAAENTAGEPIFPGSPEYKAKVSSGTRGTITKISEHVINLEVAKLLEKELQTHDIDVVMVRDKAEVNISNRERAEIANTSEAHLFVRLHCDYSSDPQRTGIGLFYPSQERELVQGTFDNSKRAASIFYDTFKSAGFTTHEPISRSDITGFNWSKVPVLLVEMGFMSNPEEDKLLSDSQYRLKLAKTMSQGILHYLEGN